MSTSSVIKTFFKNQGKGAFFLKLGKFFDKHQLVIYNPNPLTLNKDKFFIILPDKCVSASESNIRCFHAHLHVDDGGNFDKRKAEVVAPLPLRTLCFDQYSLTIQTLGLTGLISSSTLKNSINWLKNFKFKFNTEKCWRISAGIKSSSCKTCYVIFKKMNN